MSELTTRLSLVSQEKSRLENRNNILEKVLLALLYVPQDNHSVRAPIWWHPPLWATACVCAQVVKIKTDHIADLEGRSANGHDGLSTGQQALRNALWCVHGYLGRPSASCSLYIWRCHTAYTYHYTYHYTYTYTYD